MTLKSRFGRIAGVCGTLLTAAITLAIPNIPPIARLFGFVASLLQEVGMVALGTVLYVMALDTVKVWYYRTADSSGVLHGPRWLSRRKQAPVASRGG